MAILSQGQLRQLAQLAILFSDYAWVDVKKHTATLIGVAIIHVNDQMTVVRMFSDQLSQSNPMTGVLDWLAPWADAYIHVMIIDPVTLAPLVPPFIF